MRALLKASPGLCATDTRLVMLETYETAFGIYNHNLLDAERPMANVAMHYAENASEGSLLDERLNEFAEKEVPKYFGLSVKEFFEYPSDVCMKILEICAKRQRKDGETTDSVLSSLERSASKS